MHDVLEKLITASDMLDSKGMSKLSDKLDSIILKFSADSSGDDFSLVSLLESHRIPGGLKSLDELFSMSSNKGSPLFDRVLPKAERLQIVANFFANITLFQFGVKSLSKILTDQKDPATGEALEPTPEQKEQLVKVEHITSGRLLQRIYYSLLNTPGVMVEETDKLQQDHRGFIDQARRDRESAKSTISESGTITKVNLTNEEEEVKRWDSYLRRGRRGRDRDILEKRWAAHNYSFTGERARGQIPYGAEHRSLLPSSKHSLQTLMVDQDPLIRGVAKETRKIMQKNGEKKRQDNKLARLNMKKEVFRGMDQEDLKREHRKIMGGVSAGIKRMGHSKVRRGERAGMYLEYKTEFEQLFGIPAPTTLDQLSRHEFSASHYDIEFDDGLDKFTYTILTSAQQTKYQDILRSNKDPSKPGQDPKKIIEKMQSSSKSPGERRVRSTLMGGLKDIYDKLEKFALAQEFVMMYEAKAKNLQRKEEGPSLTRKRSSKFLSWLEGQDIIKVAEEEAETVTSLLERAAELKEAVSSGNVEVVNRLVDFYHSGQEVDKKDGSGMWNRRSSSPKRMQMAGAVKERDFSREEQEALHQLNAPLEGDESGETQGDFHSRTYTGPEELWGDDKGSGDSTLIESEAGIYAPSRNTRFQEFKDKEAIVSSFKEYKWGEEEISPANIMALIAMQSPMARVIGGILSRQRKLKKMTVDDITDFRKIDDSRQVYDELNKAFAELNPPLSPLDVVPVNFDMVKELMELKEGGKRLSSTEENVVKTYSGLVESGWGEGEPELVYEWALKNKKIPKEHWDAMHAAKKAASREHYNQSSSVGYNRNSISINRWEYLHPILPQDNAPIKLQREAYKMTLEYFAKSIGYNKELPSDIINAQYYFALEAEERKEELWLEDETGGEEGIAATNRAALGLSDPDDDKAVIPEGKVVVDRSQLVAGNLYKVFQWSEVYSNKGGDDPGQWLDMGEYTGKQLEDPRNEHYFTDKYKIIEIESEAVAAVVKEDTDTQEEEYLLITEDSAPAAPAPQSAPTAQEEEYLLITDDSIPAAPKASGATTVTEEHSALTEEDFDEFFDTFMSDED